MSALKIVGTVISEIFDFIDDNAEDEAEAEKLKTMLKAFEASEQGKLAKAKAEVILCEAKGSFLQKNWRPIVMLLIAIMFLLTGNENLADMLRAGLGGFVGMQYDQSEVILEFSCIRNRQHKINWSAAVVNFGVRRNCWLLCS